MNDENIFALIELANAETAAESGFFEDYFEGESRRYSRRFDEEEEAKS